MNDEPYKGIGRFQPMDSMTARQRAYWYRLDTATRLAIRNGTAPGMSDRQLTQTAFADVRRKRSAA